MGLKPRALLLIGCLMPCACGPERLFIESLPEAGSDFSALVLLYGEEIRATGLIPSDRSLELPFPVADEENVSAFVMGFSRATLEVAGPLPELSELDETSLELAEECEPTLTATRTELIHGPDRPPPRVTASWWTNRCPDPIAPSGLGVLDVRCPTLACPRSVLQTGCNVTIDLEDCGVGRLSGVVQPDGSLCLRGDSSCSSRDTSPGAQASFECTVSGSADSSCGFDLIAQREEAFEVEELWTLGQPQKNGSFSDIDANLANQGYLGDLLVTDDLVAVVHYDGFFFEAMGLPPFSRVALLDRRNGLQQTATSTVFARLMGLARDPMGSGILAVQDTGGTDFSVLRFSHDGELLTRSTVNVALDGHGLSTTPLGLRYLADEGRLLAFSFIGGSDEVEVRTGLVHELDPVTLEATSEQAFLPGRAQLRDVEHLGSGRVAVATDAGNQVIALDTNTFEALDIVAVPSAAADLGPMTIWPDLERVSVLTIHGRVGSGGVYMLRRVGLGLLARAGEYEREGHALSSFRFDDGSGGVLITKQVGSELTAYVSAFDPGEVRILAGSTELGYGVPGASAVLDDRSVLVALPFSGQIVRATRR